MADGVETVIEDARWNDAGLAEIAPHACSATLAHLGLDPSEWEIGVLGCDDARIAALNAEYRDRDGPTNVLSWPSADRTAAVEGGSPVLPAPGGDPGLGDIAISYDTCLREARRGGVTLGDHMTHLLVHATLHLMGFDHICEPDGALMERHEIDILITLGVADPYIGRAG